MNPQIATEEHISLPLLRLLWYTDHPIAPIPKEVTHY